MSSIASTVIKVSAAAKASGGNGGESELKRQIAASGATAVAVDPKQVNDPYVRYVMPSLMMKRGGAHGGSILLSNLPYICQVLRRAPTILLKFFAGELGCRVIHAKDPKVGGNHDTFTVIGHHEEERLMAALYKFNERCVLCHRCRDPVGRLVRAEKFGDEAKNLAKKDAALVLNLSTTTGGSAATTIPATFAKTLKGLSSSKLKSCLTLDCKGCGHVSFLDPADKLQGFLSVHLQQQEDEEVAVALKTAKKEEAAAAKRLAKAEAVNILKVEDVHDRSSQPQAAEGHDGTVDGETQQGRGEDAKRNGPQDTSPPPPALSPTAASPLKGSGTQSHLEDGDSGDAVNQKKKKQKKDKKKKDECGVSGEMEEEEENLGVSIPMDAVQVMALEMRGPTTTSAVGEDGNTMGLLKPAPTEAALKSVVAAIARMYAVEGGKQGKMQLVIRALLAFNTTTLPSSSIRMGTTESDTPPPTSSPTTTPPPSGSGVILTEVQASWLLLWQGSKTLDRALKAEGVTITAATTTTD